MSSRPLIKPFPAIQDGDMSADIVSEVTVISNLSMISYAYAWDGTAPIGTISVEVSNDYTQNADGTVRNPGTWTKLALSTDPITSGNTGNGAIDIDASAFYAIRTRYTRASGTGTLQATVAAKVS